MSLNPDLFTSVYKPDVLSCLADLSNDEVFTPPDVANRMLDMLPQELFRDPETKFLEQRFPRLIQYNVECAWGNPQYIVTFSCNRSADRLFYAQNLKVAVGRGLKLV